MMNFVQEDKNGYCNNNDEEDHEEKAIGDQTTKNPKFPFSSFSSSSSSFALQQQNLWLGTIGSQQDYKRQETPATNFDKKSEFMDLSLGNTNEEPPSSSAGTTDTSYRSIEKEHMFDKVVTPSDVGKLNRLVIPKQHAEKYFPLDSSSNEKGLLLNFEDRTGKAWRFRYSYWNSSQSYVMTKGWSRFVKEKKLDAGDIVSFQRGVGDLGKDRLYIDWRRRPDAPDPTSLARLQLQNQLHFQQPIRLGRFYSLPQSIHPRSYDHFQSLNYNHIYPYHHHHHQHHQQMLSFGNAPPIQQQQYYLRSSSSGSSQPIGALQEGGNMPMVIDSVPVVHGKAAGKRLRLFGVNMDCPIQDDHLHHQSSSYLPPLQSRLPNDDDNAPFSTAQSEYSKKGKSSMSFDLDL